MHIVNYTMKLSYKKKKSYIYVNSHIFIKSKNNVYTDIIYKLFKNEISKKCVRISDKNFINFGIPLDCVFSSVK